MDFSNLSDDELFGRVEALAETERFSLTDFLLHLAELDSRPACQRKGYASVFAYLTRRLGYAECDAMRRVRAARAVKKYPSILGMLARGELHLVSVALLQPVLDSDNHERLLRRACRRSTREVESMVAGLLPSVKEPRDRIRALPSASNELPEERSEQAHAGHMPLAFYPPVDSPEISTESAPSSASQVESRVVFTFAANEQMRSLFKQAQDLLRHKFPRGRMEEILGEALLILVEQKLPGRPRRSRMPERLTGISRRIPLGIQDAVWRRDGGRCAFVGSDGVRCEETAWLEFDHIKPWSQGGRSDDASSIRLLCRAHNQYEARRLLGS